MNINKAETVTATLARANATVTTPGSDDASHDTDFTYR